MSQFKEFLNKVQDPGLILESFGSIDIHETLITDIVQYLRNISVEKALQLKHQVKENSYLIDNSFSLAFMKELIQTFSGTKEDSDSFAAMVKFKFIINSLSFSFQNHLEEIKEKKFKLNDIITKKIKNDDYSIEDKNEMQNLLSESNAIFYFWYLLHQNVEEHKNPKYNFFDLQKAHRNIPNLGKRFILQNFDQVQRTSNSPVFFVLSMITNPEEVEDEEAESKFCLVGIYLDIETNKLTSYRYELLEVSEISNMKFFDALEMLAI